MTAAFDEAALRGLWTSPRPASVGGVYLAQHPRLPRKDALKILPERLSDGDYRDRFLREANLAAGLWHPNIIRVNDRGEINGQLWIAMDYIDADAGKLLAHYPAGMPASDVAEIVTAVADALDYAQRRDCCTGRQTRQHYAHQPRPRRQTSHIW